MRQKGFASGGYYYATPQPGLEQKFRPKVS